MRVWGWDGRTGRRRSRGLGRRGTAEPPPGHRSRPGRSTAWSRQGPHWRLPAKSIGKPRREERVRGVCAERSHEPDGRDRRPPRDTGDSAKAAVAVMWCGDQVPSSPRRLTVTSTYGGGDKAGVKRLDFLRRPSGTRTPAALSSLYLPRRMVTVRRTTQKRRTMRLLLVEDELQLAATIAKGLRREGFAVDFRARWRDRARESDAH